MTEAYTSLEKILDFYGDAFGRLGSQIPFNFEMIDNINVNSTPADYKEQIDAWLDNMPSGSAYVPNWVVGNHDNHRVADRFGRGIDVINMLVQILPGVAISKKILRLTL
jgi:alpha-glucosidase